MHFVIDLMVNQIVHITYVLCIYYRLLTALIERKKIFDYMQEQSSCCVHNIYQY